MSSPLNSPLAVFGGLFDPVHKGHVSAANFALEFLAVERLKMIPCHLPNHKAMPSTQSRHRLAMLELATDAYPGIEVDAIECQSDRISYTVDTLTELKKRHNTLVFVLGVDSFNSLPEWHEWRKMLDLSHLLILSRHGETLSEATLTAVDFARRSVATSEQLLASSAGQIVHVEGFDFDMASSEIRKKLSRGGDVSLDLHASVINYIKENGLYQDQ